MDPASEAQYAKFVELQRVEYGEQLLRAGEVTPETRAAVVGERLDDLIRDRLRSRGHEVLVASAADGSLRVGWLWVSPAPDFIVGGGGEVRWLSQWTVEEGQRRRGFGRAILVALEQALRARGVREIWLRVFDWNVAARRPYASLGYELVTQFPTDAHFRKRLV